VNRILFFTVMAINMLTLLYKVTIEMDFGLLSLLFINSLFVLFLVNNK
jgi:hypothetical protein